MSNEQDKNKKALAKKLVEINLEDRRQIQYMYMKEWDLGVLTGSEAIQKIVDAERVIFIDAATIKRARGKK